MTKERCLKVIEELLKSSTIKRFVTCDKVKNICYNGMTKERCLKVIEELLKSSIRKRFVACDIVKNVS